MHRIDPARRWSMPKGYIPTPTPEWWNGRHAGLKIPCRLTACGFDSHLGHDSKEDNLEARRSSVGLE